MTRTPEQIDALLAEARQDYVAHSIAVLESIVVDCQGASVCGEPEMGLESIYHKASDAISELSAASPTLIPDLLAVVDQLREENARIENERADQWRKRREAEGSRDLEKAIAMSLKAENARMREALVRISRETAEDHIGDTWVTPAAMVASAALTDKEQSHDNT